MRSGAAAAPGFVTPGESGTGSSATLLLRRVAYDRLGRPQIALLLHGLVDDREGRAVDVAAGALLHVELAVCPEEIALTDGVAGHARADEALEDVEVDLLVVGLGGDGT